jgi:hypothetical protein
MVGYGWMNICTMYVLWIENYITEKLNEIETTYEKHGIIALYRPYYIILGKVLQIV